MSMVRESSKEKSILSTMERIRKGLPAPQTFLGISHSPQVQCYSEEAALPNSPFPRQAPHLGTATARSFWHSPYVLYQLSHSPPVIPLPLFTNGLSSILTPLPYNWDAVVTLCPWYCSTNGGDGKRNPVSSLVTTLSYIGPVCGYCAIVWGGWSTNF